MGNAQLIVHEVVWTGELSSRISLGPSSTFLLRASVLDAGSGKAISAKDFGTLPDNTSIQATSGGLLVRTGQLATFYSRDFVKLQQVALVEPTLEDVWLISVSATGKTVMLNRYDRNESRFEVRDGSTFKPLKAWRGAPLRFENGSTQRGLEMKSADGHKECIRARSEKRESPKVRFARTSQRFSIRHR